MRQMLTFRAIKDFNVAKRGEVWELTKHEYKLLPVSLGLHFGICREHYYTLERSIDNRFASLELTTKDLEDNFEWVRGNGNEMS